MAPHAVRIIAPSRIHFGLLSLAADGERRYGGAGVVVARPPLILEIALDQHSSVSGPLADRAQVFLDCWCRHTGIAAKVRLTVVKAPDEHMGLGVGTQLGMSVAWGLDALFARTKIGLEERVTSVQRGLRSAVGAYGFTLGGLIVEDGKTATEPLGRLRQRVELPARWHVLLVRLHGMRGLAGVEETRAFTELADPCQQLASRLRGELYDRLLPAAQHGDFLQFSESVYQYGLTAGQCFAAAQGGPFLSDRIGELVRYCREQGVAGVGQSSWGPTVYGWFPDPDAASRFAEKLAGQPNFSAQMLVTSVSRSGAKLEVM